MSYETLLYTVDGPVATITLNRPEQLNTIVPPMPDEVEAAVGRGDTRRRGEGDRASRRGARVLRRVRLRRRRRRLGRGCSETDGRWDPGKDFAIG